MTRKFVHGYSQHRAIRFFVSAGESWSRRRHSSVPRLGSRTFFRDNLSTGPLERAKAKDISCHSFLRMARAAAPLMTSGGVMSGWGQIQRSGDVLDIIRIMSYVMAEKLDFQHNTLYYQLHSTTTTANGNR